jgi:hypothetical protein
MRPRLVTFDWRSIKKWCLLATFVMLGWLLVPVVRCSFAAFRDTPLSEAAPHDQPDGEEPQEDPGFFSKLGDAIGSCYARTPLLGQESWKSNLMFGFAALTVFAYGMAYLQAGKAKME